MSGEPQMDSPRSLVSSALLNHGSSSSLLSFIERSRKLRWDRYTGLGSSLSEAKWVSCKRKNKLVISPQKNKLHLDLKYSDLKYKTLLNSPWQRAIKYNITGVHLCGKIFIGSFSDMYYILITWGSLNKL